MVFSFRSTCHGTSPSIIHSTRNAKQASPPFLESCDGQRPRRATHTCIYIYTYVYIDTVTCFAKLCAYIHKLSKWHTSSNEGQPSDTSSRSHPATFRLNWTHGSALAPFGTRNKLKQLPRHLWDKLHKRAVYTTVTHGLVFCAPAWRVCEAARIYRREWTESGARVFANESDISWEKESRSSIPGYPGGRDNQSTY